MGAEARRLARRAADRLGLHVGRKRNYDLVPRTYYSPLPDFERLPADIWDRRTSMSGIDFDTAEQISWCERELGRFVGELDAPRTGTAEQGEFFFENGIYEYGDAELTYAMVRRFKPRRIMELGSGFSTLVLASACVANESDGHRTELIANDPYERGIVSADIAGVTAVRARAAEEISPEEVQSLEPNDMLFVDTTHVVKLGSDVNHIVLELLPALSAGVLVHFHDIWLPDEYHRALTEILGQHWTEQYLLQAFLVGNRAFRVLFAAHAMAADHPERVRALVPGYRGANYPSSFWLQRTDTELVS